MNNWFHAVIRAVFLFAYGAFLYASLRHIAYFFASFEPAGSDWTGAYALAISIDVTALILTIGIMFFKRGMPWHALVGVWFFIFCLTGFSWLVNWEYAVQFQGQGLSRASAFEWVNPILASAFAFLNLAYSVIAELFNSKPKTAEELQQELADIQQKSRLELQISDLKNQQNSSWITGKIRMFSDAISAAFQPQIANDSQPDLTQISDEFEEDLEPISSEIENEITVISASNLPQNHAEIPLKLGMIEQRMFDAFMQHPQEAKELLKLSHEQNLDEFVATLQNKYSRYASYITPERVTNVLRYIAHKSVEKEREVLANNSPEKPAQYFMTFEEASRYTGYAISTLKKQLNVGEIVANKSGDKLKVSTLRIRTGMTGKMPALQIEKVPATNGRK